MAAWRDLLNADLVRRAALPLRTGRPGLYSRLNSVRKRLLTGRSGLAAYQANAIHRFWRRLGFREARVLEIGSDPEMRVLRALRARGAGEAVGVNNSRAIWATRPSGEVVVDGTRLIDADAADLPFPDASFDLVFSVAVFEHLLDLPRALEQMHRVLVPGGSVFAAYGPIWSGCKGHHLSVALDGEELRHFLPERNPLPDFCHLLLSPEELREALSARVEAKWIDPIVHYLYRGTAINRLFHHQYLEAFARSPFRIEGLHAERDPVAPSLRRLLEFRHPAETCFDVTNAEVVLAKDA